MFKDKSTTWLRVGTAFGFHASGTARTCSCMPCPLWGAVRLRREVISDCDTRRSTPPSAWWPTLTQWEKASVDSKHAHACLTGSSMCGKTPKWTLKENTGKHIQTHRRSLPVHHQLCFWGSWVSVWWPGPTLHTCPPTPGKRSRVQSENQSAQHEAVLLLIGPQCTTEYRLKEGLQQRQGSWTVPPCSPVWDARFFSIRPSLFSAGWSDLWKQAGLFRRTAASLSAKQTQVNRTGNGFVPTRM